MHFFLQIWEGYGLYIPHDPTILYPNHYPNDIIIFPGQGHFSFLMVNSNMIEHQYCHLPYHCVSLYLSKVWKDDEVKIQVASLFELSLL